MNEYTPGPWRWDGPGSGAENADKVVDSSNDVLAWDIPNAADAILMAAAPDLLAALQEALRERPSRPGIIAEYWDWMDDARAAIAKATGKHEESAPTSRT